MSEPRDLATTEGGPLSATVSALRNLEVTLDRAGWELLSFDADLTGAGSTARIQCARADGLWIEARVDRLGRAALDRFVRRSWLGKPQNVTGNWPLSPQIEDTFLGRDSFPAREIGSRLAGYLTDNAPNPAALANFAADLTAALPAASAPPALENSAPAKKRPAPG